MATICKKCRRPLRLQRSDKPCPWCGSREREVIAPDQSVANEKARVALELARKHYQIDPGIRRIIRFFSPGDVEAVPGEPIKFLMVNDDTVGAGVLPLYFGPAPERGIPFATIIAEVTPEEFQQIEAHELPLPDGWSMAEELPNPAGAGAA